MPKILAVIVTYHPSIEQLKRLLGLLMPQVQQIIIIDNSATALLADWFNPRVQQYNTVQLMCANENLGLGAAHNRGIHYAKQHGYDFVLQFDQDSLPSPDMVVQLTTAYQQLRAQGYKVAAVGPNWVAKDHHSQAVFLSESKGRITNQQCPLERSDTRLMTDFLITSGCLIPIEVIDDVGPLDESLFIDWVDIEWGFRALHKGYRCFGVCSAILTHELGDETVQFLGMRFHVHSPLRHYYLMRNSTLLLKRDYLSTTWKLSIIKRLVLQLSLYPLIFKPHLQHLKMMLMGLWHGIRGISGIYPPKG